MVEMKREPIPYGPIERDLSRLAADRVQVALHSVLQLTDDPGQRYMITMMVHGEVLGALTAAFELYHEVGLGTVNRWDMARAMIDVLAEGAQAKAAESTTPS